MTAAAELSDEAGFGSPPDTRFVDAAGIRWHVRSVGSGPSLLLIHGAGSSIHTWDGVADRLRSDFAMTIVDLPAMILQSLTSRRTALILVEAVGCESFPLPYQRLSNHLHWYRYCMGPGQYLALTSGKHFVDYPYPPGYRLELFENEDTPYPFSGVFQEMPNQTIGRRFGGRSAAVGNRSILTHLAAGTDIAIECFARGLYSHGVLAMVRV